MTNYVGLLAFGKDEEYNQRPLPVIQGLQNKRYVWDSKAKEYSNSEGKKQSRAYDKPLQIEWPNDAKPLLYFLIELIQNPNFLPD